MIERCLRETVAIMDGFDCLYEVIVVDDGSSDGTAELARSVALELPRVRVVGHEVNLGKGSAVVRGSLAAVGDLVLFLDADLEIHPRQLAVLYDALVRHDADIAIGSKLHPGSVVDVSRGRRRLTLGYYLLVRALFRLPVHDTQTGLKLYRRDVLVRVLPRLLVKRFALDLELLVTAHRLGYRIVEAPVVVTRMRPFGRLTWRDVRDVAIDTAAIWYRTYLRRWYDRQGEVVDRLLDGLDTFDPRDVRELSDEEGPRARR